MANKPKTRRAFESLLVKIHEILIRHQQPDRHILQCALMQRTADKKPTGGKKVQGRANELVDIFQRLEVMANQLQQNLQTFKEGTRENFSLFVQR
ncbi:hypothetical protein N9P30_02965 [Alphaproteobacteria bacterium]|nr:hypothetical protein [Alphaproteobacteria bacterium]